MVSKEEKTLPLLQQQRYKMFQQAVEQVYQTALQDASSVALRTEVIALQQCHDQLLSSPMDELAVATQHWVQSYQVEIDKQLRLLSVDLLFLQAARQAETAAQRRQQVRDRLNTLQRYCEALLGEERSEG